MERYSLAGHDEQPCVMTAERSEGGGVGRRPAEAAEPAESFQNGTPARFGSTPPTTAHDRHTNERA